MTFSLKDTERIEEKKNEYLKFNVLNIHSFFGMYFKIKVFER